MLIGRGPPAVGATARDHRPKLLLTGRVWAHWPDKSAFGYLPDISRMGFDSVLWVDRRTPAPCGGPW